MTPTTQVRHNIAGTDANVMVIFEIQKPFKL